MCTILGLGDPSGFVFPENKMSYSPILPNEDTNERFRRHSIVGVLVVFVALLLFSKKLQCSAECQL